MWRTPYRARPEAAPADEVTTPSPLREEVVSYVLLAAAGGLPVIRALEHHDAFHAEATIGLFMLIAGVLGLAGALVAVCRAHARRSGPRC